MVMGACGLMLLGLATGCSNKNTVLDDTSLQEVSVAEATMEDMAGTVEEDPCAANGHTWIEATCTEPKTCSICRESEGEALGHEWLENTPNYQQAKTCERCGETEGSPLEAVYEERGITVVSDWDVPYTFPSRCKTDESKICEGKITYTNFTIVNDDEELGLDAADGYEWITFDTIQEWSDENALQYGIIKIYCDCDRYYESDHVGNDENSDVYEFTVNYNGNEYTECREIREKIIDGWNEDGTAYISITSWHVRIPSGYDGCVFSTLSPEAYDRATAIIEDKADILFVDLLDDNCVNFRPIVE